MPYNDVNARRELARKMYEAQCRGRPRAPTWWELHASIKRDYELAVEALFVPNDQEVCDALAVFGWRRDAGA